MERQLSRIADALERLVVLVEDASEETRKENHLDLEKEAKE